jgi:hypothetical protein
MVFNAATEDSYPGSMERRAYGFALVSTDEPAVKTEGELFASLEGEVGKVYPPHCSFRIISSSTELLGEPCGEPFGESAA